MLPPPSAEQLECLGDGVVAPDALLELDAADVGRHRAALGPVKPAVRPPLERVGNGMGILHAEALEQHFRVAVRHVVAVSVRVEEEIRDL